ncbi:MAG: hypothetical protein HQ521_15145 [Bacteroidetes bacterium]|nr:hypothetical protein [Bacteroidota bacterium]
MHNRNNYIVILVLLLGSISFSSCENSSIEPENPTGKLRIEFSHYINGENIIFDSMAYINDAGNNYLVNEIQYFISDVTLHKNDGSEKVLNSWKDIHYIDTDIKETSGYTFKDDIEGGDYIRLSFTFGINEEKNNSLMFVNPPESFMFWPELLGGGYHYMKLNGKWINESSQPAPFNFHLGIGQIYYSFPDSISEYVQNHFVVELPEMEFNIQNNETTTIKLIMNVDRWFNTPNTYDHNFWGGDIMQNQDAMQQAIENGQNVFSYSNK